MSHLHLANQAATLPTAWQSTVLAQLGTARLKVLRMDGQAYPAETHPYLESLLVIDGQMLLDVAGVPVTVAAGELYVVPAGTPHAVAPGSHGTLVIFDTAEPTTAQPPGSDGHPPGPRGGVKRRRTTEAEVGGHQGCG